MSHVVKFPEASSIAIHAMIFLARAYPGVVSQREVAAVFDISENHLAKVMLRLRMEGLVKSVRGPTGGFRLQAKPDTVTLLTIHEAITGKELPRECLFARDACRPDCPLGSFIHDMDRRVLEFLANTTLGDLLDAERAGKPAAM